MEHNDIEIIVATATGDIWICPICNKEYRLIHRETKHQGGKTKKIYKHDFEEIIR